ncbi:MAG: cobalamin biosynthesis protein [Candidatus Protistobacter heckmanni]|nr:cobalamin biosynthesis protein [Candidatus Protistobacter heckmanni]
MLLGLSLGQTAALLCAGLLLGEPRRWHPLVGFGRLAAWLERRLNPAHAPAGASASSTASAYPASPAVLRGLLAWTLAVLPFCLLAWLATRDSLFPAWPLHALLLYFGLGLRSLRDHTRPIELALEDGRLDEARALAGRIVSRDTQQAAPPEVAKAAVESLLENGNDAVFGSLFWFLVAGGPGVLLFRLANTLDAMWGYRNARYHAFGKAAARIDDALAFVPARLTALSYSLVGRTRLALHCWRTQARAWPSPNGGPAMSAGAGALGLALGSSAVYDGVEEIRPPLGEGRAPEARDIGRAWRLVALCALLWAGAVAVAALILALPHAGGPAMLHASLRP